MSDPGNESMTPDDGSDEFNEDDFDEEFDCDFEEETDEEKRDLGVPEGEVGPSESGLGDDPTKQS